MRRQPVGGQRSRELRSGTDRSQNSPRRGTHDDKVEEEISVIQGGG